MGDLGDRLPVQRLSASPWKGGSIRRRCRRCSSPCRISTRARPTNGSRNAELSPALEDVGRCRVDALDLLRVGGQDQRRVGPGGAQRERLAVARLRAAQQRGRADDPLDGLERGGLARAGRQTAHACGSMSTKRAPPGSPGGGVAGLELQLAAHPPRQLGADREAEAEAGRGRVLAALEALEDRVALGVGDAGAAVEDADLDVAVDRARRAPRPARRARSGGRCRPAGARSGRRPRGRPWPSRAPPARSSADDRTRPRPRARARRARSARCAAARPRRAGERSSRPLLRPLRRWACSERLLDVLLDALGVGLVDGQLEQVLQARQRRPQLVRGGRDEHAAGVLLLREPLLQPGEGARQLAQLVAGGVDLGGREHRVGGEHRVAEASAGAAASGR